MKKKVVRKGRKVFKKRPCRLCKDNTKSVDYKDINFLNRFVSDRGRIITSRITGNCAKHQRMVANAIKRARLAALLPFVKLKEGLPRRRPRRAA
ncbi:MAG: 30S ribosomal protein S18 [Candidatus Makaraimicrobium thalassicum]|nr:MAG: 30S ribosomal protein S18 [Candidatus Omnitrophota bacterium]